MSVQDTQPTNSTPASNIWYKNYLVLIFVIGLPVFVVIICIYFIIFSIKIQDSTVRDDWYMDGKTLYQDASRDQLSYDLGVTGILRFDDNKVKFELNYPKESLESGKLRNQTPVYYPKTLSLNISHATDAKKDKDILLAHTHDNIYEGELKLDNQSARYYVQVGSEDQLRWRLTTRQRLPVKNIALQPLDAFKHSQTTLPDQRDKRGHPSEPKTQTQ